MVRGPFVRLVRGSAQSQVHAPNRANIRQQGFFTDDYEGLQVFITEADTTDPKFLVPWIQREDRRPRHQEKENQTASVVAECLRCAIPLTAKRSVSSALRLNSNSSCKL